MVASDYAKYGKYADLRQSRPIAPKKLPAIARSRHR